MNNNKNRANRTFDQLTKLSELFEPDQAGAQQVLTQLGNVKFPNDTARKNWMDFIRARFGTDIANTVDKYAGNPKSVNGADVDLSDPGIRGVVYNLNGILKLNPGV